ncbi:MAG: histone H1-like repetitive region-containing protein [Bdellovibrionales bacterium]|nr:histone H1-like repetitive region-containing protein [Massilia sp.]
MPASPATSAAKRPDVNLPLAPDAPPVRAPSISEARNTPTPRDTDAAVEKQIDKETQERVLEHANLEREKQGAERARQAELMADGQREAARQAQLRQDAARAEQTARSEAARQDAARQELGRQTRAKQDEAARQEALKQETARSELVRQEAARQQAARQESERQDAIRQYAARREAEKLDAARQESAKQEAARRELAKQEAAKQDAIGQESARQEAAKQAAAQQERAKQEQAQRERSEREAQREERLRAIGKQLNAEAAQRDAAATPSRSLLQGISSLRRGWLLGRADPNGDLVRYAEAMSQKIELNMTFDMVREAVKQPHARPIVTIAVRADGSVEKVTFVVSSDVPAIDEAIRKVVASQAPYAAFPPSLARQYDVIEIRRTWIFDTAIRLQ